MMKTRSGRSTVCESTPPSFRRCTTCLRSRCPKPDVTPWEDYKTLPWLDLNRGRALGLPSGQAIADAMGVTVLSGEQLRLEALDDPAAREALRRATPLWFYILCEAASEEFGDGGRHLGPVGGRIVAEVLVGLVEGDPDSYLYQCPTWRPELPAATQGDFTMADPVRFATRPEQFIADAARVRVAQAVEAPQRMTMLFSAVE